MNYRKTPPNAIAVNLQYAKFHAAIVTGQNEERVITFRTICKAPTLRTADDVTWVIAWAEFSIVDCKICSERLRQFKLRRGPFRKAKDKRGKQQ
jgi:hypothetical protein